MRPKPSEAMIAKKAKKCGVEYEPATGEFRATPGALEKFALEMFELGRELEKVDAETRQPRR